MKIEYDDLTESDLLVFARNISEQHKSKIRKLTPRSASLLWSTYCYPGRFDFRARCHDGNEAMLISRTAFDELDEEPTMNQIAPWLCSIVDAVETESVHLLRAEWGIDGFELPWEVFLATWYWLLPFCLKGMPCYRAKTSLSNSVLATAAYIESLFRRPPSCCPTTWMSALDILRKGKPSRHLDRTGLPCLS